MSKKRAVKLTMSGFRSFADQTSIDLSDGYAVISNPDDDVVSDIAAALCFLTDRPSAKIKGIRDIVFQGTSVRHAASSAEVSLSISDSGKTTVLSRRMYPDGRSAFYIDGGECSRDELREAAGGSGRYGYSVIDHNTVTDIITSRPGSLAFMIEQAAGVTDLREKLLSAEKELKEKNTELDRINSFLEEYSEKKKYLQDEAIRAKDYKSLNAQLKTNELNIILRKIEQCERSSYLDEIQIKELEKRIEENESERDKKENSILEKKNRVRELDAEDIKNRDSSMGFMSDINDTKAAIDVADGNIDTITENIDVINADCVYLTARADDEREYLKEFEKKRTDIAHNITNNRHKKEQAEESLRRQKSLLSDRKNEYEEISTNLAAEQRNLASVSAELDGAVKIERISAEHREGVLNMLETREDELPDEALYRSDLRTIDSLVARREQLMMRRSSAAAELEEQKKKIDKLADKRELSFKNKNEEETRYNILLSLDKNYEGYSESAKALLQSSSIRGIYGAAGELLTVARGYEFVLERALGKNAECIICEDMQCAIEGASLLKSKNAGRLVFLPLRELDAPQENIPADILEAEGCLGRALDFVNFESDYTKAFQYILGNTVVFKSMGDAEAAESSGRIRIVTLDGDILSEDGVIESGSMKESEDGIFRRKSRLYESETLLHSFEKDYSSVDSEYRRANEEYSILKEKILSADKEIRECDSDISSISSKTDMTGSRITAVKKAISSMKDDIARTEKELTERKAAVKKLEAEKESAETSIRMLEQRQADKYKEIEDVSSHIRDLEHELEEIRSEAAELDSQTAANDSAYERIRDNIARAEKDLQDRQKDLESVKEELASARRDRETLVQKCRIQEMNYTDRSTVLGKLREEIDGSRDDIEKLQSEKEVLEKELINFVTEKRALEVRKESSDAEAEGMKKDIWETYGVSYAEALENKSPVFVLSEGVRESGRIRNSLGDLGDVNIGAVEELEYVREKVLKLERRRSDAENTVSSLGHDITRMKLRIMSQFKNTFEAVDADFRKRFTAENGNAKARLRMTGDSETLENDAEIVLRETAQRAKLVTNASDSMRADAFNAVFYAVLDNSPAPLVIVENIDRELGSGGTAEIRKNMMSLSNISFIFITSDESAAADSKNMYELKRNEDDTFRISKMPVGKPANNADSVSSNQGE